MFERPIVIGQRLRWRYADSNQLSEDAEVVNVRTDREEGLSPEAMDYIALWVRRKIRAGFTGGKTLYDLARHGQADLH